MRVSRSSNSNSFPHSGTPQVALNFPLLGSGSDLPFDHDPSSALRTGDAGAKNAVSHGLIIGARISSSPQNGVRTSHPRALCCASQVKPREEDGLEKDRLVRHSDIE